MQSACRVIHKISIMTLRQYQKLTRSEGFELMSQQGVVVDEVTIYGMLRLRMYSFCNFYVQVLFNKNDHKLLEVKALESDDDWQAYLEAKDLKTFY